MNVLFTGKVHRRRRIETILHPPKGIVFWTECSVDEKEDYELSSHKQKKTLWRRIKDVKQNHLIPKEGLKVWGFNFDLIYSPGKIVFNKFPWVVEIDNVACLSYYNLTLLKLLKPIIKWKLKSKYCKKIICISYAAKAQMMNFFSDSDIADKCTVVYPYVKPMKKVKRKDKKIRLLYVSTHFFLKGGREILRAFEYMNMNHNNVELVIVSNTRQDIIDEYKERYKNIKFVKANLSKEELYKKYYSQSDIFLQLSYQDSFNLATLEAISCGLPVIATDMFAIPEMVHDDFNGFLLNSPINYFDKEYGLPNQKYWGKDLDKYVSKSDLFLDLECKLITVMDLMISNKEMRKTMGKNSEAMVAIEFSEDTRKEKLRKALTGEK